MTKQESIMRSVVARLETTGARVLRNVDGAETVPPEGVAIVQDGEPGEPEVSLSPLAYSYSQQATLIVAVQSAAKNARQTSLDELISRIGQALPPGPLDQADWIAPGAPVRGDVGDFGTSPVSAASIPLNIVWTTENPLI